MRVLVLDTDIGERAAYRLAKSILDFAPTSNRPFVLGVSLGHQVLSMFRHLVALHRDGLVSFAHVWIFNTGEYVGVSSSEERSCARLLFEAFVRHVDINPQQVHNLNGKAVDLHAECLRYEQLLAGWETVHLFIGDLGANGSVALNEPGSSLASRVRCQPLGGEARDTLCEQMGGEIEQVPSAVLTIGIAHLMDFQEALLLASGTRTAHAVQSMVEGPVTHMCPASALQQHQNAILLCDEDAAVNLRFGTVRYFSAFEIPQQSMDLVADLYRKHHKKVQLTALVHGVLFNGQTMLENYVLLIKGSVIYDVVPHTDLKALEDHLECSIRRVDVQGRIVAPGFMDLQVNGCGGVQFNDRISEEALGVMFQTNLEFGTTSFLPTLISTSDEKMREAMQLVDGLKDPDAIGVLGLHLEGPWFALERRGVHQAKYIRGVDSLLLSDILNSVRTRIVTLAPEMVDCHVIRALSQAGIVVSMGHTNGNKAELTAKIPCGIHMATHLHNAMSPMTSREPGAVGVVLDYTKIAAGIIVDGVHADYSAVEIATKVKGEHLFLVTDAVSLVGTGMDSFMFEGEQVFLKDDRCVTAVGQLAGSVLTMDQGVRNLVNHVHLSIEEALRMASLYPAKAMRLEDRYGYLRKGYIADVVILSHTLRVEGVVSKGRLRYQEISEISP